MKYYDCYQAGVNLEDLFKGCAYFKRAQWNQSSFEEEVDGFVCLAVNRILLRFLNIHTTPIIRSICDAYVMPSPKKN